MVLTWFRFGAIGAVLIGRMASQCLLIIRVSSVNFNGPIVDNLDAACRSHDKDCAHPDGCSRASDLKLIRAAWPYTFDVMDPNRAYAAKGIMTAITLASFTRSR